MGIITVISIWIIPVMLLIILLVALYQRLPAYELFVEGGKEGIEIAFSLLPFLVGMIVAITILRSSGALDAFVSLLTPILALLNIPPEIVPLALLRPISGTAALSLTAELTNTYGPDSFIGRLAATMQGSTDTTLYILTIYFGAVGVTKMRYALKVGLLADLVGIMMAIVITSIVFGP
ncbi:MAG TPA: spore maturation protein [Pseudogracilibacillus sp.]|nr:spore maturation protein [Pseudogracilibacillus sp.]